MFPYSHFYIKTKKARCTACLRIEKNRHILEEILHTIHILDNIKRYHAE